MMSASSRTLRVITSRIGPVLAGGDLRNGAGWRAALGPETLGHSERSISGQSSARRFESSR